MIIRLNRWLLDDFCNRSHGYVNFKRNRKMKKKIAVIGLGRFARQLARQLYNDGIEVIAVDKSRLKIEQIAEDVTVAVQLDCTDEQALKAQGIDKVDAAVIGVREDFETLVLTTVILKSIGVKKIYCRAERQVHSDILKRIGADQIIMPEDEAATRWSSRLGSPHIKDKLNFAPGYSLVEYTTPKSFDGKSIVQLNLRKKYNVNVIALNPNDGTDIISIPTPDTILKEGDTVWLVANEESLAKLPSK